MTLAVGDLCTVVYAGGGVRVALPVEVASANQLVFLSDFGTTGQGVPLRLRTIEEVASTVPEDEDNPRINRVIGTIARDADSLPMFVPLGVLPVPDDGISDGVKTVFVVFADTAPVDSGLGGSFPQAFYRRTSGEWDKARGSFEDGFWSVWEEVYYGTGAYQVAHLGGGLFRETVMATPIVFNRMRFEGSPASGVPSELTPPIGTTTEFLINRGYVSIRGFAYYCDNGTVFDVPQTVPIVSGRTWQVSYEYFPLVIQRVRDNFEAWDTLPAALVYHLPLASDAPQGTLGEILPTGIADTSPLEIINTRPTVGEVVARIAELASNDGIAEVRFITALASHDAATSTDTLIAEIVGSLEASYGRIVHSTTVATGNDWLGALADSAEDMPDA